MPMQRNRYPVDWDNIATEIKHANDWQCQLCGKQCRRPGEQFDTHRRTLTVAHIWPDNHDTMAPAVCVAALCAACHLGVDVQRRGEQSRAKAES